MKSITIYFILLFSVATNAQTLRLNYEPTGKIIQFYFDSLTIYTDTTSLFSVYESDRNLENYDLRVKNFVLKKIRNSKLDTVTFSGEFIPFEDSIIERNQNEWYVEWAILHLTKANRLKIYDKHGQLVTTIVTRKVGKKKDDFVKRSYKNLATDEELFAETLLIRTITPKF
jgi:hypothetical protein